MFYRKREKGRLWGSGWHSRAALCEARRTDVSLYFGSRTEGKHVEAWTKN